MLSADGQGESLWREALLFAGQPADCLIHSAKASSPNLLQKLISGVKILGIPAATSKSDQSTSS